MSREISVFAPAKINLFLEVLGKRENKYHDISTLFAKTAFGDNVKIAVEKSDSVSIELKLKGPFAGNIKSGKTNLAYKAADAFFDFFAIKTNCSIRLEKNVPPSSGLGGGSSDAAAIIKGLCALFNIETNAKRMKDIVKLAAKLGADVPFFLYDFTFAKGEGIGEIITPVQNRISSPYIIIAYPGQPSSTKEAYQRLRLNSEDKILTNISNLNKLINSIESGSRFEEWRSLIYNKLEDCVLKRLGSVGKLKKDMLAFGADAALMSGSGSCVFAFTNDEAKAQKIAEKINVDAATVFLTHFWRINYENN
ncbi:MAG: 4-(cytidine 5'-diphospho)-2-C-methyl-D-erythritol kinase [Elusimicrobiota bacterium]|jgi:4-diphosphocytidyl-2-C-methyl-D-erythritol kinase|nr:4-(cytidine 5'-diphospho)-2-C-methyl-D-erythritol kinase [Elusimicrobiota bacterium]